MMRSVARKVITRGLQRIDNGALSPQPTFQEENHHYPEWDWDLRTVIALFPKTSPVRILDLNTILGMTGVSFDRPELFSGPDEDAFDLQFAIVRRDGEVVSHKRYYSIGESVQLWPGLQLNLQDRLSIEGGWPNYRIQYRQDDLSLSLELESRSDVNWWARFPALICHYTTANHCRLSWQWHNESGEAEGIALFEHGWGNRTVRVPLCRFQYEVLRINSEDLAVLLNLDGPHDVPLRDTGAWLTKQRWQPASHSSFSVVESERHKNYRGQWCRVPKRWHGRLPGRITYEAVRRMDPLPLLGDGFLYGFDFEAQGVEGEGYAEWFGNRQLL